MEALIAAASSLVALLGVWLGAALSARSRERAWAQERRERGRESRQSVYAAFLVAMRQYIAYVTGPDAEVTVVTHSAQGYPMPVLAGEGADLYRVTESAYAELQLAALHQETVNKAHLLARAGRRIAVAVAQADQSPLPIDERKRRYWEIEREFVNQVRRELDLPAIGDPHDGEAVLP